MERLSLGSYRSLQRGWVVLFFSGQLGFAPQFLSAWEKPNVVMEDPVLGPEAVCTATELYLRKQPSVQGATIGKLKKGEIVKILNWDKSSPLGKELDQNDETIDGINSYWFRIVTQKGQEGFVFGGYLEDIFSSIRSGNFKDLAILLSSGANINQERIFQSHTCGAPEIHFTPLYLATELGNQKAVEYLLKSWADPNKGRRFIDEDIRNATEIIESPLMVDLSTGIAKTLLTGGANPNQKTADGRTPLSIAVEADKLDIASILLSHGADVNLSLKDRYKTLMHHDSPALRKWLASAKWNPNMEDSYGWTLLMHSTYNEMNELTHFIRLGGSPDDGLWKAEFLLLLKNGPLQDIKTSISKIPTVDFDSPYGSPLAITLANRRGVDGVSIAKLLLEAGAPATGIGVYGAPLLCDTVYENETPMLELLLNFGGDVRSLCFVLEGGSETVFDKFVSINRTNDVRLLNKILLSNHFGPVQPSPNKISEESASNEMRDLLAKVKTVHWLIETRIFNDKMKVDSLETIKYWRGATGSELSEGNDGIFRFFRNEKEAWLFDNADTQRDHWSDPKDATISSPFPSFINGKISIGTSNSQIPP